MSQPLHIICFDNPYPPSYGGAIDVFYRIRSLSRAGYAITLHCFYKGELQPSQELEQLCRAVYYYPRKTSILRQLSLTPYGVASRTSQDLLPRLLQDDAPILFEGLVSCALMSHPMLRNRRKLFRECNVEHDYYHALGRAAHSVWKKVFYHIEACRLRRFERCLTYADQIWALAHQDEHYFRTQYPQVETRYVPCSHGYTHVRTQAGEGQPFILYHGNLAVEENEKAAMYIIRHLAPHLTLPIVIAGNHPSDRLRRTAAQYPVVQLIPSPDQKTLEQLIRDAHIHLLITFQATGIKLKLLNVLYNGRHVIVNPPMVVGTEYESLCHVGQTDEELIELCNRYRFLPLTEQDLVQRERTLHKEYQQAIPDIYE